MKRKTPPTDPPPPLALKVPGRQKPFQKGDRVTHPGYSKARGIVCRSDKTHAYVEWVGFPPDAPTDGHYIHAELRRSPAGRKG